MKYFYKILRLFFCPHRYDIHDKYAHTHNDIQFQITVALQCRYCGKIKTKKLND